ncbi:MAG: hypothetical protein E4H01_10795 [Lysobacterales bacterium]|nr:MAG: hypothetical protein E4H01_10795 [Xanthomonadales bacterium]
MLGSGALRLHGHDQWIFVDVRDAGAGNLSVARNGDANMTELSGLQASGVWSTSVRFLLIAPALFLRATSANVRGAGGEPGLTKEQ